MTRTLLLASAALLLAACAGPEGNPNASPYADEPGGAIAVRPETIGREMYDPYAPAQPFDDMRVGAQPNAPAASSPPR